MSRPLRNQAALALLAERSERSEAAAQVFREVLVLFADEVVGPLDEAYERACAVGRLFGDAQRVRGEGSDCDCELGEATLERAKALWDVFPRHRSDSPTDVSELQGDAP